MAKNVMKSVYCACHIDNSTSDDNHISLTGAKFSGKPFSFDVWLYILGDAQTVLSQEGGISFGLENGVICISHPSMGKKTVRSDVLPINKKEWVNVFGVYDGQKLSFAVNGIPVGQVSCPNISFWSADDIDIGKGLHGYCRSVRLYDIAVPEEQYHIYLHRTTYDAQAMPGLAAFMDMMQKSIPDLSGRGVTAVRHGAVGVVDLAHIYRPSSGRYASPAQGDAVNPGGFESGAFALYIKTYLRPSNQGTHALVSNGEFGDSDSVIVYTEKAGDTGVSVHLCLGAQDVLISGSIEVYQWVDIIVCYQAGKVTAFINGTAFECAAAMTARTGKGAFKIGNAFGGEDCTCGHYIAVVAVFDTPLSQADANAFLENHPFIFESGLIALFSFVTGSPQELVSCGAVQCDSDDLIAAQRTFETLPQTPYKYRVNKTQAEPSKMRLWQATTIWSGVKSYYRETYGMVPVQDEAQEKATVKAIATDSELLAAFAGLFTVAAVTAAIVAKAISAVKIAKMAKLTGMGALSAGGAAGGAAGAAAAAGTAAAGAGALQIGNAFAALAASVALIAAIAAAGAEIAKELRKDKPDEDDDDDDEAPVVKLLAISLQHTPDNPAISAVRCRDHEGSRLPPEWTHEKRTGAEAVYIADQMQNIKIKVKFKIQDHSKKPASSYSVSLWSFAVDKPALFDDFSLTESGLSRDVEYEREITAQALSQPSFGLWKHELALWWNYTVNGHTATLPNTKLTLYTVPTTPVEPVGMTAEDKEENIQLICLRLGAKLYSASTESSAAGDITANVIAAELVAKMNELYACTFMRYDPNPHLFVVPCNVVTVAPPHNVLGHANLLDVNGIYNAIRNAQTTQAPVSVNCNVYATVLCHFFALMGVYSEIIVIQTGSDDALRTNRCFAAPGNQGERNYQFAYHAIVEVPPQPSLPGLAKNIVFDACIQTTANTPLGDLIFRENYVHPEVMLEEVNKTYRGHVFEQGTRAIKMHNRKLLLYLP